MIGKTVSHYKVLEKLGEGGMGIVYKAQDLKLDRFVALKFLPSHLGTKEEEKERFIHEAKAASALDHPNICTIHEIDETEDGHLFIAMAYYEGEMLDEKIKQGPLKLENAIDIAIQIAQGLEKAHKKEIVHRDIKPGNILLTEDGIVKVLDFGLAKLAGKTKLTKAQTTLGTVAYMSPEQSEAEDVDRRTDIWSLGVVIYEMVTGQRPFSGAYDQAVVYSILNEAPEPMTGLRTGVPVELERIVNKCLDKEPSNRYQRVDELNVDLNKVKQDLIRLPSKMVEPEKVQPVHRTVRSFGIVAIAALVVLGIYLIYSQFLAPRKTNLISERKMLVVLPFENLGPPEDAYFADGITEEITSRLAGLRGLGVISRNSAVQYAKTDKNTKQIGEELGVDYVLEGTVRWDRSGDSSRVRITPQLIRASDDIHLWANTYDEILDEVFVVQSEIAEEVAKQLDLTLMKPDRDALEANPTQNFEAYDFYLRGGQHIMRFLDKQQLNLAAEMYEKAVELDPTFAVAYVYLSITHSLMYYLSHDQTADRLSKSKAAVDKAMELRPDLPNAHIALAYYYYWGYSDDDRALRVLEGMRRAWPNYTNDLTGDIQKHQGNWSEAIATYEEVFRLNPLDSGLARNLAMTYQMMRHYREAEIWFERTLSLDPKDVLALSFKLVNAVLWKGDLSEGRLIIESLPEGFIGGWPTKSRPTIQGLTVRRMHREALPVIASLPETPDEIGSTYNDKHLLFAQTYWYLNDFSLSRTHADTSRMILVQKISERPGTAMYHAALGLAYAYLGRKQEAIREGERAVALVPVSEDADDGPAYVDNMARIYVIVGEYDLAIEKLEYLMSIPALISVHTLLLEPHWDDLRSHPRFQRLLEKYSGEKE